MEPEIQTIHQGICPLCKQEAKWEPINFGSKKKFKCPNCMTFLISPLLEETITDTPKSDREKISKKSVLCKKDMMLHIYRKDGAINLECVLKSSWPR